MPKLFFAEDIGDTAIVSAIYVCPSVMYLLREEKESFRKGLSTVMEI